MKHASRFNSQPLFNKRQTAAQINARDDAEYKSLLQNLARLKTSDRPKAIFAYLKDSEGLTLERIHALSKILTTRYEVKVTRGDPRVVAVEGVGKKIVGLFTAAFRRNRVRPIEVPTIDVKSFAEMLRVVGSGMRPRLISEFLVKNKNISIDDFEKLTLGLNPVEQKALTKTLFENNQNLTPKDFARAIEGAPHEQRSGMASEFLAGNVGISVEDFVSIVSYIESFETEKVFEYRGYDSDSDYGSEDTEREVRHISDNDKAIRAASAKRFLEFNQNISAEDIAQILNYIEDEDFKQAFVTKFLSSGKDCDAGVFRQLIEEVPKAQRLPFVKSFFDAHPNIELGYFSNILYCIEKEDAKVFIKNFLMQHPSLPVSDFLVVTWPIPEDQKSPFATHFLNENQNIEPVDFAKVVKYIDERQRLPLVTSFMRRNPRMKLEHFVEVFRCLPLGERSGQALKFLRQFFEANESKIANLQDLLKLSELAEVPEIAKMVAEIVITNFVALERDSYEKIRKSLLSKNPQYSALLPEFSDFPKAIGVTEYLSSKVRAPKDLTAKEIDKYEINFGNIKCAKLEDAQAELSKFLGGPKRSAIDIDQAVNQQFRKIYKAPPILELSPNEAAAAKEEIVKFFQLLMFKISGDVEVLSTENRDNPQSLFSAVNREKLITLFNNNRSSFAHLLQDPQSLDLFVASMTGLNQGCVANIGNKFTFLVARTLFEKKEDALLYAVFFDKIFLPIMEAYKIGDPLGYQPDPLQHSIVQNSILNPTALVAAVQHKINEEQDVKKYLVFREIEKLPKDHELSIWLNSFGDEDDRRNAASIAINAVLMSICCDEKESFVEDLEYDDLKKSLPSKFEDMIKKLGQLEAFKVAEGALNRCQGSIAAEAVRQDYQNFEKAFYKAMSSFANIDEIKSEFEAQKKASTSSKDEDRDSLLEGVPSGDIAKLTIKPLDLSARGPNLRSHGK